MGSTLRFGRVELVFFHSTHSRVTVLQYQTVAETGKIRYNLPMNEQKNIVSTDTEATRAIIAQNLTRFRKLAGLTQQQLAEKLNYSDKTVSKWERAEGIPDVLTLKMLAQLYGVTVNDFLIEHKKPTVQALFKSTFIRRLLIALLSSGLAYFVAAVASVVVLMIDSSVPIVKYAFLTALPVSFVVLLVFACLWCNVLCKAVAVSALTWSLCLFADVLIVATNSWLVYVVGGFFQVMIVLWFQLSYVRQKERRLRQENEKLSPSDDK